LLSKGLSCESVAEILLMDDDTVRNHGKRYLSEGLSGLLRDGRKGSSPKLDACQRERLDAHLRQRSYPTTTGIIEWIYKNFGVVYTPGGAAGLLHRMGYVYKKPKKMPKVAPVDVQQGFVERYNGIIEGLGPDDSLLFMDGAHPLHNSVAAHGWFKRGSSSNIPSNTGRKRVNINGALDIRGKRVSIIECEGINAQSVIEHLKKLLGQYQRGTINIILDNARYYRAKVVRDFLEEHPRIRLVFLPPYCPNLNLIERLWLVMKKEVVFNKFYERFADFRNAIMDFFENGDWKKTAHQKFIAADFHILKPQFFSGFKMD